MSSKQDESVQDESMELLSVAKAREQLLAALPIIETEEIPIEEAHRRVLSEPFHASGDYPTFANSSMDGFAVQSEDIKEASRDNPIRLKVVGDIPAGSFPKKSIRSGESMRIMTGAPTPLGANAVVPVEGTDIQDRGPSASIPSQVQVFRSQASGNHIRPMGQDYKKGDLLLLAGQRLRAQDVAMIAMNGAKSIQVHRKARVVLFSTGDELQSLGEEIEAGQIFDSNSILIKAMCEELGAEVFSLGIAPDNLEKIIAILEQALQHDPDLIISSAGVSVGAYDFLREAIQSNGSLDFWRVNMRPGKPLAFGSYRQRPYIGLPGNPVSSYVSFEVFGRPALQHLQGSNQLERPKMFAKLNKAIISDGRESYLRANYHSENGEFQVNLTGHQGSGNLYSLVQANCLIRLPAGEKDFQKGSMVEIWSLA